MVRWASSQSREGLRVIPTVIVQMRPTLLDLGHESGVRRPNFLSNNDCCLCRASYCAPRTQPHSSLGHGSRSGVSQWGPVNSCATCICCLHPLLYPPLAQLFTPFHALSKQYPCSPVCGWTNYNLGPQFQLRMRTLIRTTSGACKDSAIDKQQAPHAEMTLQCSWATSGGQSYRDMILRKHRTLLVWLWQ